MFRDLVAKHDVTFVFPEQGHKRMGDIDISALDLCGANYEHLSVYDAHQKCWTDLFHARNLRWRPGAQPKIMRRIIRFGLGPKAGPLFTFFALPGIFWLFCASVRRRLAKSPPVLLDRLLDKHEPDVVIHPSVLEGIYINDLMENLRRRNVPLVVIMNSWDNPSTKQTMVGKSDWLLVWGQQTWEHSIELLRMPPDRVVSFGAAQFDVYRDPPSMTREAFCRLHDIDPASRILLYAGSSKDTDEFAHLCAIEQAIECGELANTTVVYRPHPWGRGGTGGERMIDNPWKHVRLESTMLAYLQAVKEGNGLMSLPDYRHTRDVLNCIDALVSPLSTIILEGALFGKPELCFLPEDEEAEHFQMAMPLMHFEPMYDMPEILIARGGDELIGKLAELMDFVGDDEFATRLKQSVRYFVEPFDAPFRERLVTFVEGVADR